MLPSAANGGTYEVHCPGLIARSLKPIQHRANAEGRGKQVLLAIRRAWHRLSHDPLNFGEAIYRLPALRMQIRQGAIRPLFVDFGVCEDRPLVFIRGVKLL